MKKRIANAVAEIFVIMFLLYANVLMGFFTVGQTTDDPISLVDAFAQLFTWQLFATAFVAAAIAFVIIEKIRK